YFDDFETGCEDWDAAGWANILNHAPQSAWVQVAQHDGNRLLNLTRELLDGEQAASLLMSGQWSIPVVAEAQEAIIIVSPFAPLTTVPMPYALNVAVQ
ncbi:MAG: hypothetical protein IAE89_10870, partial [Anaerolineae bacterium]|nr:hypothetical protein [Anaerolineae bacterium]